MNFRPVPPLLVAPILALSDCDHATDSVAAVQILRDMGSFSEYQRQVRATPAPAPHPHFEHTLKAYAEDGLVAASVIAVTGSSGETVSVSLILQAAYCDTAEEVNNACIAAINSLGDEFTFPAMFQGGLGLQDWMADGCPSAKIGDFVSVQTAEHPNLTIELFAYKVPTGGWRLVLDWTVAKTR